MNRKSTINDVARLAEVSKKTVSRVINKSPKVSDRTREKVEKVVAELNYSPDPQARGLAFRKSFLLGLVYDNPNPSYVAAIQEGVLGYCRDEGYELVVHPCDRLSSKLLDDISRFIERLKLDGVVLLPPISENPEVIALLQESTCQYVRILSVQLDDPAHLVQSNDRIAVEKIANHLMDLGHREFGFIHGPKDSQSAKERYEGFINALATRDLTMDKKRVTWGDYTFDSGLACAEELLSSQPGPTAIFASNDEMALGVLVTAAKLGMKVPLDLSVVGFDDEPHASKLYPSLTTVNQHVHEMGQLAAEKLLALCRKDHDWASEVKTVVTPNLVVRESTAQAKH